MPEQGGAAATHCIVLVKQVPDVTSIPEDAWDRDKGTLRRGLLDSVLNPLDLQALTFARRITEGAPDARTVYLTMGPPQAREVLVECLARVPGEAVLLTDRSFAGADTVATAYSLACAIRRIERELLGGSRAYVIVAGMQSVDGDTAQVPPQIAEDLGLDHIAYVKAIERPPASIDTPPAGLTVRRIGPEGAEVLRPLRYPVLVTVTASVDPLYRSFTLERQARTAKIHEWSADSVGALADRIGLKGSRTQVCRIFSPTDERAKTCLMVNRPDELVELIRERYRAAEPAARQGDGEQYRLNGREPEYRGEFWVFAEREGDGIRSVSLELLGKARQLAGCLGERVAAVLACDRAHDLPRILFAHGAEVVYTIEHPLLAEFHPITYKKAVAAAVRRGKPQAMFFGATPLGRELAPRVAYACDCGLTADCTKLEIGDLEKGGLAHVGILKQTRPALGGNIMATIITRASATQMATVRPGVFRIPAPDPDRVGEIVAVAADLSPDDVAVETVTRESFGAEDSIRDAEVIVAGGRGLRSRSDFERHLQPLADGLSQLLDCRAEIGASRMAVEDGYVGHDHQVGQTGQTVQPRLYVAVGISGAVQHISGMQNSDIVVAINRDPRARIFSVADFGMVGDVEAILPDLVNAVGGARSDRSTH